MVHIVKVDGYHTCQTAKMQWGQGKKGTIVEMAKVLLRKFPLTAYNVNGQCPFQNYYQWNWDKVKGGRELKCLLSCYMCDTPHFCGLSYFVFLVCHKVNYWLPLILWVYIQLWYLWCTCDAEWWLLGWTWISMAGIFLVENAWVRNAKVGVTYASIRDKAKEKSTIK